MNALHNFYVYSRDCFSACAANLRGSCIARTVSSIFLLNEPWQHLVKRKLLEIKRFRANEALKKSLLAKEPSNRNNISTEEGTQRMRLKNFFEFATRELLRRDKNRQEEITERKRLMTELFYSSPQGVQKEIRHLLPLPTETGKPSAKAKEFGKTLPPIDTKQIKKS